ncbi:MAG: hypothetical protein PHW76_08065 [Alphaproteobacteria bacterium]|nr:hypothetical protein [Alphaproteobacteria bacterium]
MIIVPKDANERADLFLSLCAAVVSDGGNDDEFRIVSMVGDMLANGVAIEGLENGKGFCIKQP